jgi:hypothetical protein
MSALLVGVSIGWSVWTYLSLTRTPVVIEKEVALPAFDTSAVDAVKKVYEVRGEEARRYEDTYRFVDPSR